MKHYLDYVNIGNLFLSRGGFREGMSGPILIFLVYGKTQYLQLPIDSSCVLNSHSLHTAFLGPANRDCMGVDWHLFCFWRSVVLSHSKRIIRVMSRHLAKWS